MTTDGANMFPVVEEHKALEPFIGSFRAKVSMWMGPGEPLVSTGTMSNSWVHGGRFLRHEYNGDPSEGPFPNFEGSGFWGYNTADKRYEGFWIDNASNFMQLETGQVDKSGRIWTMHSTMTDPKSGKPMNKKSVITLKDNDHHTMAMHFEVPGTADMHKVMEIEYSRA